MKARAVVHTGPFQVEVQDFELREPSSEEVIVQARYTCISPGTELRCLAGKQPESVPFPYIPGYAMVGAVLTAGSRSGRREGELVYLNGTSHSGHLGLQWGGHASHAVARGADCIPVPEGVDLKEASLAHLIAIAINGVWVARPEAGNTVLAVGLGVLGQLCVRLYLAAGCRVVAADRVRERVELATKVGAEGIVIEQCLCDRLQQALPDGADIIVDATGSPAVLAEAIKLARDLPWGDPPQSGAKYVVQGSYPDAFCVPYQTAFRKELTFLLPRDCRPSQRREALEMLAHGKLRVDDLISTVAKPEDAPRIYDALRDPAGGLLTAVFEW